MARAGIVSAVSLENRDIALGGQVALDTSVDLERGRPLGARYAAEIGSHLCFVEGKYVCYWPKAAAAEYSRAKEAGGLWAYKLMTSLPTALRFPLESLCPPDQVAAQFNARRREGWCGLFAIFRHIPAEDGEAPSAAAGSTVAAISSGAKAFPPIGPTALQVRLERLMEAGAWAEAALALLELELPDWHVRRIEQDGGEWHCTVSQYRQTPLAFDDAVDGRDPLLPLAILDAMLEAKRRSRTNPTPPSSAGSQDARTEAAWVDNIF